MSEFARHTVRMSISIHRPASEDEKKAGSWRAVRIGTLTGDVIVEVDLEGLARDLGENALRAKGKKARAAGGLVLVRAMNTTFEKTAA